MKHFKCGQCQTPYKIDETKLNTTLVTIVCVKCNSKNTIRLGPVLTVQSKQGIQQFSLKEGVNLIGRKSDKGTAEIKLADQYVSREHAKVYVENRAGKIYLSIEDVGSLNGTFNKSKAKLKTALKYPFTTGDYFIVGLTKISINH
jgi:pSer/pThr/pTyr-binding forkhead associated (FHA) protein